MSFGTEMMPQPHLRLRSAQRHHSSVALSQSATGEVSGTAAHATLKVTPASYTLDPAWATLTDPANEGLSWRRAACREDQGCASSELEAGGLLNLLQQHHGLAVPEGTSGAFGDYLTLSYSPTIRSYVNRSSELSVAVRKHLQSTRDPFYSTSPSKTQNYGGEGAGQQLWWCDRWMEMLMGEAAAKGNLTAVKHWLEQDIKADDKQHFHNPFEFGGESGSPLWCAAFCGQADVATALMDAGADPEWTDSNGWTALHAAAMLGHTKTVRQLIKCGANIDSRDVNGTTPLMYVAAEAGDLPCAQALLQLGSMPVLRATGGRFVGKTAQQIAVEMGNAELAALLSNTNVEAEVSKLCASDEAALVPPTSSGEPPAITSDNPSLGEVAFKGDLAAVRGWLRYGITPSDEMHFRVDPTGYWGLCSPLWWAAAEGHTDIVAVLQQAGADSEWANSTGWTPLHISSRLGHEHTTEQLVEGGAEVNMATRSGATALMWAAAFDKPRCIDTLLELGANPALQDNAGRTALRIAAFRGHEQSCQRLVEGRAQVDSTNQHGMTALMFAAYWNRPACVKVLLRLGADPALRATSGGCEGATALQMADRQGQRQITLLLED